MSSYREGLSSKLCRVGLCLTGMSSCREGLSSKLCRVGLCLGCLALGKVCLLSSIG